MQGYERPSRERDLGSAGDRNAFPAQELTIPVNLPDHDQAAAHRVKWATGQVNPLFCLPLALGHRETEVTRRHSRKAFLAAAVNDGEQ